MLLMLLLLMLTETAQSPLQFESRNKLCKPQPAQPNVTTPVQGQGCS